jgi:hypothetical protein
MLEVTTVHWAHTRYHPIHQLLFSFWLKFPKLWFIHTSQCTAMQFHSYCVVIPSDFHTTLHLHKELPLTTEHVTCFTGYYGACNEQLMKLALVLGGPISVSFEVYPDFIHYKSGIYHHTGLGQFRPFEVSTWTLSFLMPCQCTWFPHQELKQLTLILLTWRIWWAPNNASKWRMELSSAFKGLIPK